MVSVSEVFKAFDEGFTNKDSSRLAEFLTDDFQFVGKSGTRNRQETLDWTAGGGNQTVMDNLEVLYENDEVAVTCHRADSTLGKDGLVMALYTKRGDKFSHCRIVRQEV